MSSGHVDALRYEAAREKAASLGRSGAKLQKALAALREAEASAIGGIRWDSKARDRMIWELTELVANLIIQREACGLRGTEHVVKFYDVPPEVVARLGARRSR